MLLHVGVSVLQVTTSGASEGDLGLLGLEIDVTFIADDSLGLVERLGETARLGEGVGAGGGAHVGILSLEGLSVDGNGPSLCVVSLRDPSEQLGISGLLGAAVHTLLNGELVVASLLLHQFAILSLHDLATNSVGSHILGDQILAVGGIKVTLIVDSIDSSLPLKHLLLNLTLDFTLHLLSLATNASNTVSLGPTSTVLSVVGGHDLLLLLAIDSVLSVVEHLALDGVLEVMMSLGDMGLRDCSENYNRHFSH